MSIFDVQHQPKAQRLIQRALTGERLPHAYIFHGIDGVGREMLAGRLAQVLLCDSPTELPVAGVPGFNDWSGPLVDACGACDSCRYVQAGTHPDLHLIYRELIKHHPDPKFRGLKAVELGVNVIRQFVIDRVGLKPARGRAKVFIIREADHLNVSAQNALLKTLEEPPATTFLILIVTSLEVMLPTTRSRCQQIPFDPLPADFIVERLRQGDDAALSSQAVWHAQVAGGSLGLALQQAQDDLFAHNGRVIDLLSALPEIGPTAAASQFMDQAKELGEAHQQRQEDISPSEAQRRGLRTLLALASVWYRDALAISVHAPGEAVNAEHRERLQAVYGAPGSLAPRRVTDAIQAIAAAEGQLDLNANVTLCMEALFIRLARLARPQPVRAG